MNGEKRNIAREKNPKYKMTQVREKRTLRTIKKSTIIPNILKKKQKKNIETKNVEQKLSKNKMRKKEIKC